MAGSRTYDANNRMTATYYTTNQFASGYTYDAAGKRVRRRILGSEVWQVYGMGWELLAEYAAGAAPSTPQKEYGYRNGELLVTAESTGQVNWLVTDHLGTPRMIADLSGSLSGIRRHDYLPFGEEIGAGVGGRTTNQGYSQPSGNRKKWAQLERDGETGLDYAQARYYSSTQGRFTSVDPENAGTELENPQSWNGYAYALNNPTVNVDSDGLKTKLYDKNGNFLYALEDEDANAGLFDRDWRRKNGHTFGKVVKGRREILQNGELIGYYENTCCDWLAGSRNEREVQSLVSGEAYDTRIVVGAIANVATGGLTRGRTSRTRGQWEITKAGTDKVLKHRSFGTFSRHKSSGLWWLKDKAGHGQSKWKVYRETSKGLEHVADADEYGDFILNKHKGPVGEFIPWKELSGKLKYLYD